MPPQGITIQRFIAGLHTNRSPIATPFRSSFGHVIEYRDALIDGLNVEISPANTLVRRPGFPQYDSVTYSTDVPLNFTSAVMTGTLFNLLDTNKKVYTFGPSALTAIFTKAASAGQSFFKQVGNIEFFSDGAENMKWSGIADSNTGALAAPTFNGIATPPNAPTISNLNLYDKTGHTQTTHAWIPGYTYINATGSPLNYYFMAPTGEIQWAVIAAGTTLQSAKTAPNWGANFGIFGARTIDGGMSWTNSGPLKSWIANTVFGNAAYVATHPLSAVATSATMVGDATSTNFAWQITTGPQNPTGTAAGFANSSPLTGNTNNLLITGLGFAIPSGATVTGIEVDIDRGANRVNAVKDVTVQLLKAGVLVGSNKAKPGFWPQIEFNAYTVPGSGGVEQIYGSNTDLWGTTWTPTDINNANFGVQIQANQGSTATTAAGIQYFNGNPQTPVIVTVSYIAAASDIAGTVYAQIIVDSNNNLQRVVTAGTSGGTQPTWATTIGSTTTDGGITWECLGTANQLPVNFSWTYGYSFHGTDGPIQHTSTMSPLLTIFAPIIGTGITLGGFGSNDPQVDRDDLYRTADGGSLLLYGTSTTNVNASTAWSITDTLTDQDLNFLIIGPVAHANDPPLSGMTLLEYYMGRMWGAVGSNLQFTAGPDCINGDGNQAWPPANQFSFSSNITALVATSQGLLVFTRDSISAVLGGPQTGTFWVQTLFLNFGVASPNCVTRDGDVVYFYTTSRQMFSISSSSGRIEVGFDVAPTLAATFSPTTSYIAIHRSGPDQGLFIADGSTNIQRYNLNAQCWDALATPVGGIGPIVSIETAFGTQSLMSSSNGFIVRRDPLTYSDSGTAYTGFATIGSINLSEPGQQPPTKIKSIVLVSKAVGSALTLSVLPNEISGTFTTIPLNNADPYQLPASSSINMNEYQWKGIQSMLPDLIRHIQLKITLPTEAAKNEIYSIGIV